MLEVVYVFQIVIFDFKIVYKKKFRMEEESKRQREREVGKSVLVFFRCERIQLWFFYMFGVFFLGFVLDIIFFGFIIIQKVDRFNVIFL